MGGYFRVGMTHTNGLKYGFTAAGDVEISGNAVKVGLGSPFGEWQIRARAGDKDNIAF